MLKQIKIKNLNELENITPKLKAFFHVIFLGLSVRFYGHFLR